MEPLEFPQISPGESRAGPTQAAAERLLLELGAGLESAQQYLGWRADRDLFPYQVTIKRPLSEYQDYLVIVKALTAVEPVIAFHGGYGYAQALIGMGKRGANGQLNWKKDDQPPRNYDVLRKEVDYYVSRYG